MRQFFTRQLSLVIGIWNALTAKDKLTVAGGIIVALATAGGFVYTHLPPDEPAIAINLITEGSNFLDIGRYNEAKQSFQKALAIDPQDEQAAWGLKKAELWDAKDTATFEQNLHNLYEKIQTMRTLICFTANCMAQRIICQKLYLIIKKPSR